MSKEVNAPPGWTLAGPVGTAIVVSRLYVVGPAMEGDVVVTKRAAANMQQWAMVLRVIKNPPERLLIETRRLVASNLKTTTDNQLVKLSDLAVCKIPRRFV